MMLEISDKSPRLLDIRGSAGFLGVSPWTIRGLVWDGEIPHIKAGRKIWLDRHDLERWVTNAKEVSGTFSGTRRNALAKPMQSKN